MKKQLIILAFLPLSLISWGQNQILFNNGQILIFNSRPLTVDTTMTDTTLTLIGDGVKIGDGIEIGDGAYLLDVIHPDQYMKKEEALNELMS